MKISKKRYKTAIETAEYWAEQRGFRLGYEAAQRGEKHQWFSTSDSMEMTQCFSGEEIPDDPVEEEMGQTK